jgi:hypothetical protein
VAHQHVGVGYSGGQNPDPQLIRAGIANLVFDYLEDFRPTESAQDDAGVSHFEQLRTQTAKIRGNQDNSRVLIGLVVVLRARFPHRQQTEDDDDHEHDQEIPVS